MLDSFPNVMYNKVLGIQKLQYNPGFTSTHTEHVFKTKGKIYNEYRRKSNKHC